MFPGLVCQSVEQATENAIVVVEQKGLQDSKGWVSFAGGEIRKGDKGDNGTVTFCDRK